MRGLITCIYTLLLSTAVFAQVNPLDYYKYTNRAELAICDSNFADALKYYQQAFAINTKNPFYCDVYNAFCASMDTKEYTLAEKYFQQLRRLSISNEQLEELSKIYTDKDLQQLEMLIESYPEVPARQDAYTKRLKELFKQDQGVRMYYINQHYSDYMTDSVHKVDDVVARELLQLMKQYGIPDEVTSRATQYEIILTHNAGVSPMGYSKHIFDTLLYEGSMNLEYDARKFVYMVQRSVGATSFRYGQVELLFPLTVDGCYFEGRVYPEYWDATLEKRINADRTKIGIESLDDFRKKIETNSQLSGSNSAVNKYMYGGAMTVMHADSKEQLENWLKTNGKDAKRKRTAADMQAAYEKAYKLEVGRMRDDYIIGETTWREKMQRRVSAMDIGYYDQTTLGCPQNIVPRHEGYVRYSILEPDPQEDLRKEEGRVNQSRFVPKYGRLLERGFSFLTCKIYSYPELIFDNGGDSTLISYYAKTDTSFYRYMTSMVSPPHSFTMKADTLPLPGDNRLQLILKTRTYAWVKDGKKVEIVVKDELNKKGKKITTATVHMTDIQRYAAYMEKVAEEKKRLDKLYAVSRN